MSTCDHKFEIFTVNIFLNFVAFVDHPYFTCLQLLNYLEKCRMLNFTFIVPYVKTFNSIIFIANVHIIPPIFYVSDVQSPLYTQKCSSVQNKLILICLLCESSMVWGKCNASQREYAEKLVLHTELNNISLCHEISGGKHAPMTLDLDYSALVLISRLHSLIPFYIKTATKLTHTIEEKQISCTSRPKMQVSEHECV